MWVIEIFVFSSLEKEDEAIFEVRILQKRKKEIVRRKTEEKTKKGGIFIFSL